MARHSVDRAERIANLYTAVHPEGMSKRQPIWIDKINDKQGVLFIVCCLIGRAEDGATPFVLMGMMMIT